MLMMIEGIITRLEWMASQQKSAKVSQRRRGTFQVIFSTSLKSLQELKEDRKSRRQETSFLYKLSKRKVESVRNVERNAKCKRMRFGSAFPFS